MVVESVRVAVLGSLRVSCGVEIVLERRSHRRLLSILVLDANRRIATDDLIERNWGGNAPATARAALQTHVSALRKLLPAETIRTEGAGYRLDLDGHELDVDDFTTAAGEAQRAAQARDWEDALAAAEVAVEVWRGVPFEELAADDFARPHIARLEELHLELVELRAAALIALGREREALTDLERLVVEHPLRERLWEHVMTARYRVGRHADALEAYRAAWTALDTIGLEPSAELRRLEQKILRHDEALTARARHNLPVALTSFVGRREERGAVAQLLNSHRLVTLTGVGGTGKTRLGLHVAEDALDTYPGGCWFVELAPLRDPKLVALELATVLGLRPHVDDALPAVAAAVAHEATLIVLDNCEHVVDAAGELAWTLLQTGRALTIVATSREPLRVPGEVVYEVPPMPVPPVDAADEELLTFDAVRLFVERATLARSSFTLDRSGARAVATICRRLDGIPLAIELAAGRVGSLSADEIAEHLDSRFRILTDGPRTGPQRHRTLKAALDWSYDLLDEPERLVFARLGVFQGGFALEDAAEVCAGGGVGESDVVPIVAALVDKSLVSSYADDTTRRHRLLETLREYALDRLEESGETEAVRRKHLGRCVRLAADANEAVHGAGRWELFERLDADSDNLAAALEQADVDNSAAEVELLARALAWDALNKGQLDRCIAFLRTGLERAPDAAGEAHSRSLLGTALFLTGAGDEAFAESSRAANLASSLAPSAAKVSVVTAYALLHLLLVDRDPAAAIALCTDALAQAETTGDPFAMMYALRSLARAQVWNGNVDLGLEHYEAALDIARRTGDRAFLLETYQGSFTLLYLHPLARRAEPKRIADEMLERFPLDDESWQRHISWDDWLPYVYCQSGEWERAEAALDRLGARRLEGWDRIGYLVMHGTLRWMQGRLDEARLDLDELAERSVSERWYHDYYPLLVDVAADRGRLEEARSAADAFLAVDLHPSEEVKKVGVLGPLVRAEVDAALAAEGSERAGHVERARAALARGREILSGFPTPTEGSLQMETPATYLAFAEAELSRVTEPSPAQWDEASVRADYVYFRLYARLRLAEALRATGRHEDAALTLQAAHEAACELGAARLREQLESLALTAGVTLPTRLDRHTPERSAAHRGGRRLARPVQRPRRS